MTWRNGEWGWGGLILGWHKKHATARSNRNTQHMWSDSTVNEQDCVVLFVCLWLKKIDSWVRATKEANEMYRTVWGWQDVEK